MAVDAASMVMGSEIAGMMDEESLPGMDEMPAGASPGG